MCEPSSQFPQPQAEGVRRAGAAARAGAPATQKLGANYLFIYYYFFGVPTEEEEEITHRY
jgi:hypothetical protein